MRIRRTALAALALLTLTGVAVAPSALAGPSALAAPSPAPAPAAPPTDVVLGTPLPGTHAHNDYEHARPLFDALEQGFTSVEADVWLVDGQLLVGHDLADVKPGVTLDSLYVDPLEKLASGPGHSVYPRWPGSVQLLIDVKSEGESTYAAVDRDLAMHPSLMTRYSNGRTNPGPVTAVISGNRALETMRAQTTRFAFYDGRAADLSTGMPSNLMPLVSDNWTTLFTWQGVGPMPVAERAKLRAFVRTAHSHDYRVRFWATPDVAGAARDAVWTELADAGVDHINTDDLVGLKNFLNARTHTTP
ncbi:phosphatidylinositol-specific phospholipase C/glycerophosphodiester phosphodiesterase family protein [Pengzhenrongella sp.]|jgi:hypothetical protein|uniref:phosphatidylinositol-specific phospholipase C/glycerophosphodiester phosphodiesterase family protein n=1 Tax=Pengzhenrongella sp. TaxID=2888820 RepID=UPI002F95434E